MTTEPATTPSHRWRSPLLGEPRTLDVPGGTLDLFERGAGPVLVFSHGWLSNANIWRKVVDRLHEGFRCVVLDLPLGSHRTPMGDGADLTPAGVAELIVTALEALDLEDATLVGNDSGGAYAQIALARFGERVAGRVGGLVLTSSETPFDEWPPEPFHRLPRAARDKERLARLLGALEDAEVRASDVGYGLLLRHPVEPEVLDGYALSPTRDPELLDDVARVMAATSTAAVREAGRHLIERSDLPVLLVWSDEDPIFPLDHARRYAAALTDATLAVITDALSFTPEDAPGPLADAIARFVRG